MSDWLNNADRLDHYKKTGIKGYFSYTQDWWHRYNRTTLGKEKTRHLMDFSQTSHSYLHNEKENTGNKGK